MKKLYHHILTLSVLYDEKLEPGDLQTKLDENFNDNPNWNDRVKIIIVDWKVKEVRKKSPNETGN